MAKQTRSNKSTLRQLTSFITLHGHKAGYLESRSRHLTNNNGHLIVMPRLGSVC